MTKHISLPLVGISPVDDENLFAKESQIIPIPLTSEPQSIRRRSNVVLFGEMGVGKSSVVNLILGHDEARTSSGAVSCTLDARPYDVTVRGQEFRIFDTVGLNEPQSLSDPDNLIAAINKAYGLVKYLSETGGISLLVFCVRRGRITVNTQQNYKLFHDFLCYQKVPVAIIVTNLEHHEPNMEDWWQDNESHFTQCGIDTIGHACITAKRDINFIDRYNASRKMVHDLLLAHGCGEGFTQERVSWVTELFQKLLELVNLRPRLDSFKVRARKLREYGLRDEEIGVLLVKISAVDEDFAIIRPPRRFSRRRGRRAGTGPL
ncbi:hypothetical protein JVU11DRAFT_2465 [Chiua virens]|nr:hypothetical protein JVU11DRAFT_2465 [Chiua virens]